MYGNDTSQRLTEDIQSLSKHIRCHSENVSDLGAVEAVHLRELVTTTTSQKTDVNSNTNLALLAVSSCVSYNVLAVCSRLPHRRPLTSVRLAASCSC